MKCPSCSIDFKKRHFHKYRVDCTYCERCFVSRIDDQTYAPKSKDAKKTNDLANNFLNEVKMQVSKIGNTDIDNFRVLVWGPTESENIEYINRKYIKDELLNLGHDAKFSEDFDPGDSLYLDELTQVSEWKELLIVIVSSFGSVAEVSAYESYMDNACLIWFPAGTEGGFPQTAFRENLISSGAMVEEFSNMDLSTRILGKYSVFWVYKMQCLDYKKKCQIELMQKSRIKK